MSENPRIRPGARVPGKGGRRVKHGAFALVFREEVAKQHPELERYVRATYNALVHDLAPGGPDTLPAAKQLILDRLMSKLQIAGLLDIFLGKNGIIRRDRIDERVLECEPALNSWLSVNHSIVRDLQALGLERLPVEPLDLTAEQLGEKILQGAVERTNPGQGDEETGEACPVPGSGDDRGAEDYSGANSREAGPGAVDGGDLDEDGEA